MEEKFHPYPENIIKLFLSGPMDIIFIWLMLICVWATIILYNIENLLFFQGLYFANTRENSVFVLAFIIISALCLLLALRNVFFGMKIEAKYKWFLGFFGILVTAVWGLLVCIYLLVYRATENPQLLIFEVLAILFAAYALFRNMALLVLTLGAGDLALDLSQFVDDSAPARKEFFLLTFLAITFLAIQFFLQVNPFFSSINSFTIAIAARKLFNGNKTASN